MFLQCRVGAFAELGIVELGSRRPDDPELVRKQPVGIEAIKRRQEHAAREVAGRAEHHEGRDPLSHGARYIDLDARAQAKKPSAQTYS